MLTLYFVILCLVSLLTFLGGLLLGSWAGERRGRAREGAAILSEAGALASQMRGAEDLPREVAESIRLEVLRRARERV